MRTQLKSTLALVLALLICVSVFAACKGKTGTDTDSSSTPTLSFADVPSEAQVDIDAGTITMAYGKTFADLKADLIAEGKLLEDQGEVLRLYKEDKVTEITDEATPLENGMVAIKLDANGTELFSLTLVIEAAVTSQQVNSDGTITVTREDGTQQVVNSQGEVISTIPAPTSSNGGTTADPTTSVTPGPGPDGPTSSNDDPVSIDPSDIPTIPPSSALPVDDNYTLTIAGDTSDNGLMMAMMAFQKAHKNIKIRIQATNDGGKYTGLDGLKMQLASNNAPDIVQMDSVYVAAGGYQNHLLDLRDFGSDEIADLFIPSCWESVKSQRAGETAQFGLPFDCNTILMFYNKDLLDTAGVTSAPENWGEMTAAMERLKALPNVTSPFNLMVNFNAGIGQKNYMAFQWMMYLWRLGGDVLSADLKSARISEQAGIDALQMYVDMVTKYGVSNAAFSDAPFFDGTAGFNMMTNNHYKSTIGGTSSIHFGVTMLPELKAGVPRYSGLGLYSFALPNKISAAGKDPEKIAAATAKAMWAYEFIKFYTTSLTYQLTYCDSTLLMPSLKAGEGQGQFKGDYWTIAYNQLRTSKFRPGVKNWESIEGYISDAINAAVNNQKTAPEALKAAATLINRQLA